MQPAKKITILFGSPNEKGSTASVCEAFIKGAKEAGALVETFFVGNLALSPVNSLYLARLKAGEKVDNDGVGRILEGILNSDVIVFATPVYFFGMSSQLKLVLDRFMSVREKLLKHPAQCCLLATSGSNGADVMSALVEHYKLVCNYFKWKDAGKVLAAGTMLKPLSELNVLPEAEALGRKVAESPKATA